MSEPAISPTLSQSDVRGARLRALHEAALAVAAPTPAEPDAVAALLLRITQAATAAMGAREGRMVLAHDPAWQDLVPGAGPAQGHVVLTVNRQIQRWPMRPGFPATHVLATGELVYVADVQRETRFGPLNVRLARGIHSFAVAPLRAGGQVLGTLAVDYPQPHAMAPEDLEALELFAAHAAAALDRVRYVAAAIQDARRAEAERQARVDAEAALRERDEFLSIAAHELRTPLTAMHGYGQLLLRQAGLDPARAHRAAELVVQQTTRLERLVSQLLDASRAAVGRLDLERQPTDLGQLARQAAAAVQVTAAQHSINVLAPPKPLPAQVDPMRLEQVLINLLDNAVKYTPPGVVAVEVHAGETDGRPLAPESAGGTVRIAVRDWGAGIAPEHRPRIFDRYYRAHQTSSAGVGLGLYICREIVALHGGRLEVEFPDDGGSRFVITLPGALSETPEAAT